MLSPLAYQTVAQIVLVHYLRTIPDVSITGHVRAEAYKRLPHQVNGTILWGV